MVDEPGRVLVQVVDVDVAAGREIRQSGRTLAEQLQSRFGDIREAIVATSESVAQSLGSLGSTDGWQVKEASASFGITLTAEAGVIVSKASAGTTLEVSVMFARDGE